MVCDADTYYCLNAIPYLGKGTVDLQKGVGLGEYFTLELVSPFRRAGLTVTSDNWFTSLPLARELLKQGMYLVGTIRPKPYLPADLLRQKLDIGQSMVVYNHEDKATLLVQRVNPTKRIQLLSTLHHNPNVVERQKTEVHMYYNATKGGVDTFDQLCSLMSCSRKTRRWPLCVFYGILNLVFNNAYIVFAHRPENQKTTRRQFGLDLAMELARPHAHMRLQQSRYLPREVVTIIHSVFSIPEPTSSVDTPQTKSDKRQRCYLCPSSGTAKTKLLCVQCQKSVCNKHITLVCSSCLEIVSI